MILEPLQLGILIIVGIIAGFLNVMAGGGSMLVLPVMVFMGVPGNIANGTNRIAMLAQNITAVGTFYKQGISNFRLSLSLGLCALPGAIIGAYLGTQIEGKNFNVLLAIIMVIVMAMMIFSSEEPQHSTQQTITKNRLFLGHFLMLFVGFWGGFIMAGVGFIMLAVMNRVMGINLVSANAHKVFIEIVFTVFALAIFASQLQLLWLAGICLGFGNAIGAWVAANYQVKQGAGAIKKILYIVLSIFIIKLLFF